MARAKPRGSVLGVHVWSEVARRRCSLADTLDRLEPSALDSPSWCEGWRVRHVLGHLVWLAEANHWRMVRDLLRNGPHPQRALARVGCAVGAAPVGELTARLRAASDGRFHIVGSSCMHPLGEALVHGSDMLRALGIADDVDPSLAAPVIDVYRRIGSAFSAPWATKNVALIATDTDLRIGSGPEVRGRAMDLLLLLAGRRQVLVDLTGPGVPDLR